VTASPSANQVPLTSLSQGPQFDGLAKLGYDLPIGKPNRPSVEGPETLHRRLRESIMPEDLIVSDVPVDTSYFLGRVDKYLRQRKVAGGALAHLITLEMNTLGFH
jgi:hypothetical protein